MDADQPYSEKYVPCTIHYRCGHAETGEILVDFFEGDNMHRPNRDCSDCKDARDRALRTELKDAGLETMWTPDADIAMLKVYRRLRKSHGHVFAHWMCTCTDYPFFWLRNQNKPFLDLTIECCKAREYVQAMNEQEAERGRATFPELRKAIRDYKKLVKKATDAAIAEKRLMDPETCS